MSAVFSVRICGTTWVETECRRGPARYARALCVAGVQRHVAGMACSAQIVTLALPFPRLFHFSLPLQVTNVSASVADAIGAVIGVLPSPLINRDRCAEVNVISGPSWWLLDVE